VEKEQWSLSLVMWPVTTLLGSLREPFVTGYSHSCSTGVFKMQICLCDPVPQGTLSVLSGCLGMAAAQSDGGCALGARRDRMAGLTLFTPRDSQEALGLEGAG
jgi:hypothetical protein